MVLDPFGLAPGLPELVWDPIDGCVDPMVAERRAKAFTAGTVKGSVAGGYADDAARFYAAEAAKVLQSYFHAAALTGRSLEDVLRWVAHPLGASDPTEILREHPHAAPLWHGLLEGALHGDHRTAGNTITTVQQAMSLFFQEPIRRRCVPGPARPATDIREVIGRAGTIYLLGREDPYASASPLMTAVAEHLLDTAIEAANASPWGRLCPPMVACLDEAALDGAAADAADEDGERARPRYQLHLCRAGLAPAGRDLRRDRGANTAGPDQRPRPVRRLEGRRLQPGHLRPARPGRVSRTNWQTGAMAGRSTSGEDIPILTGAEVRQLKERHALVVAENGKPIIARLDRCIDGKRGAALLAQQRQLRQQVSGTRHSEIATGIRATAALAESRRRGLAPHAEDQR